MRCPNKQVTRHYVIHSVWVSNQLSVHSPNTGRFIEQSVVTTAEEVFVLLFDQQVVEGKYSVLHCVQLLNSVAAQTTSPQPAPRVPEASPAQS